MAASGAHGSPAIDCDGPDPALSEGRKMPMMPHPRTEEESNDSGVASSQEAVPLDPPRTCFRFSTFLRYAGPGWLMSLAYLDPGNLESDLQSGAYTGYSLIWVLLLSTCAGLVLQILAARLGAVTGMHLAQVCRREYPRPVARVLWFMTELAIVGADVQEVVGSAIAFRELFGWPLWLGSVITGLDTFTFLAVHHCGRSLLEIMIFTLVMGMMVCFFSNWALQPPPLESVSKGFLPEVPDYAVMQLVGTVGAVIMPHNIYLHSGLVSQRPCSRTEQGLRQANKYNVIDSALALGVSFFINLALVTAFAGSFFVVSCAMASDDGHGNAGPLACVPLDGSASPGEIACETANGVEGVCAQVGLQTAGTALQRVLGNNGDLGRIVFALGVLAAGQASTMTGTFAGQFVMEGFLDIRLPIWMRTLITRSVALGPAIVVALLTADSPNLNNQVNEFINILQSVQLPFALLPVLIFTSDRQIMGNFSSGRGLQLICWILAAVIITLNIYLVINTFVDNGSSGWIWACVAVGFVAYGALILLVVQRAWKPTARAAPLLTSSTPDIRA